MKECLIVVLLWCSLVARTTAQDANPGAENNPSKSTIVKPFSKEPNFPSQYSFQPVYLPRVHSPTFTMPLPYQQSRDRALTPSSIFSRYYYGSSPSERTVPQPQFVPSMQYSQWFPSQQHFPQIPNVAQSYQQPYSLPYYPNYGYSQGLPLMQSPVQQVLYQRPSSEDLLIQAPVQQIPVQQVMVMN